VQNLVLLIMLVLLLLLVLLQASCGRSATP
jgi:hypothetical protein